MSNKNFIKLAKKSAAKQISELKKILSSKKILLNVISEELINIRDKFGVDRRTEIAKGIDDVLNYNIE